MTLLNNLWHLAWYEIVLKRSGIITAQFHNCRFEQDKPVIPSCYFISVKGECTISTFRDKIFLAILNSPDHPQGMIDEVKNIIILPSHQQPNLQEILKYRMLPTKW